MNFFPDAHVQRGEEVHLAGITLIIFSLPLAIIMLNRFLFLLASACALLLGTLVVAAPWLVKQGLELPAGLSLFVEDWAVRRTAIFCAVGLQVTALVFFRNPKPSAEESSEGSKPRRRTRSTHTVGA